MSEELEHCPFCGGPAELREGEECAYVQCLHAKFHRGPFVDGDNNAAFEAAEAWNARTESTTLRRYREALERIEQWKMPATGKFHESGAEMSYSWCYGAQGERNVIQDIARTALTVASPNE